MGRPLSNEVYVTICVSDPTETWQLVAGWATAEFGPFDTASDVTAAVRSALSGIWTPLTMDEAHARHRLASTPERTVQWEQLAIDL